MLHGVKRKMTGRLCIVYLLAVVLHGCGGGIAGTGSGDSNPSPNAGRTDPVPSAQETTDEHGENLGTTSFLPRLNYFPDIFALTTQIFQLKPVKHSLERQTINNTGDHHTMGLAIQMDAYQYTTAQIYNDLARLEAGFPQALGVCIDSGSCEQLPVVYQEFDVSSQQVISYSDILLEPGLPGYFDWQFSYTRENGDTIVLQWDISRELVSLYADTAALTINSLTQHSSAEATMRRITFRQETKVDNTLIHVAISQSDDQTTDFEVDRVDAYIKSTIDSNGTHILYALNTQENLVEREAVVSVDDSFYYERCEGVNCDWDIAQPASAPTFHGTSDPLGNFDLTVTSALQIPESVQNSRFVVASTGEGAEPHSSDLMCGGRFVSGSQRAFCWTPQPLAGIDYSFYEEQRDGTITRFLPLAEAP